MMSEEQRGRMETLQIELVDVRSDTYTLVRSAKRIVSELERGRFQFIDLSEVRTQEQQIVVKGYYRVNQERD